MSPATAPGDPPAAPRLRHFADVETLVAAIAPEEPVYCLRPQVIRRRAARFLELFPGDLLYAVKANPLPALLDQLYAAGVRHFDTASLAEIALVAERYPEARSYFMHPVKGRRVMISAHRVHGVRHFALDHEAELRKILEVFGAAKRDLVAMVRLATSGEGALFDLSAKFGAEPEEAAALLRAAERAGCRVGLCFHVGSQCTEPAAFTRALALAGQVLEAAQVEISCLDVGGGFPVAYADAAVPAPETFIRTIEEGLAGLDLPRGCRLMCEPGRALVAEGMSLVTQIQLRKGRRLYINDGIYGSLLGTSIGIDYPVRLIRPEGDVAAELHDFTVFGPTCDSLDVLSTALSLPADARAGDWIEFANLGAYGNALRTGFNGFRPETFVALDDDPAGDRGRAS